MYTQSTVSSRYKNKVTQHCRPTSSQRPFNCFTEEPLGKFSHKLKSDSSAGPCESKRKFTKEKKRKINQTCFDVLASANSKSIDLEETDYMPLKNKYPSSKSYMVSEKSSNKRNKTIHYYSNKGSKVKPNTRHSGSMLNIYSVLERSQTVLSKYQSKCQSLERKVTDCENKLKQALKEIKRL